MLNSIEQKIVSFLLFATFIFALSVHHWLSGFFLLMLLMAVIMIFRHPLNLNKDTKILVSIGVLIFITTLISNTLNNSWIDARLERFEVDLKQLIALVLIVYLANFKKNYIWFFRALPIAGIVLGYEILDPQFGKISRQTGAYGWITFGAWSALLFYFVLLSKKEAKWPNKLLATSLQIFALIATFSGVLLANSRNGWLIFLALAIATILFYWQNVSKKIIVLILLTLALFITAFYQTNAGKYAYKRFNIAYQEVIYYFSSPATNEHKKKTIQGVRLAQMQAAYNASFNKPFFGYGAGGVGEAINDVIKAGKAPKHLKVKNAHKRVGHIHTDYGLTLVDKGYIGFILKITFLFFIFITFFKKLKQNKNVAVMGMLLIIAYLTFSLTEAPFIRNNHTAFFFLSLAVIWNILIHKKAANKNIWR